MDRLTDYLDFWRITLNPRKPSFTYIGAPDSKLHNYHLHIKTHGQDHYPARTRIDPHPHTKILGVIFDKHLKYTVHNTNTTAKARTVLRSPLSLPLS